MREASTRARGGPGSGRPVRPQIGRAPSGAPAGMAGSRPPPKADPRSHRAIPRTRTARRLDALVALVADRHGLALLPDGRLAAAEARAAVRVAGLGRHPGGRGLAAVERDAVELLRAVAEDVGVLRVRGDWLEATTLRHAWNRIDEGSAGRTYVRCLVPASNVNWLVDLAVVRLPSSNRDPLNRQVDRPPGRLRCCLRGLGVPGTCRPLAAPSRRRRARQDRTWRCRSPRR
jgi:hypothetical protein